MALFSITEAKVYMCGILEKLHPLSHTCHIQKQSSKGDTDYKIRQKR